MNESKITKYRLIFYGIWLGWFIVGFPLLGLFIWLLSALGITQEIKVGIAMLLAIASWMAVWIYSTKPILKVECSKCRRKIFAQHYQIMWRTECPRCRALPEFKNSK
jgi:uncharacterized membrane protein